MPIIDTVVTSAIIASVENVVFTFTYLAYKSIVNLWLLSISAGIHCSKSALKKVCLLVTLSWVFRYDVCKLILTGAQRELKTTTSSATIPFIERAILSVFR